LARAQVDPGEIKALSGILDELDYYELLHLPRSASTSAVRRAFHEASRRFHPDSHRQQDAETRGSLERIAKRVTEAYTVLRDAKRRGAYDARRGRTGGGTRMQLAEAVEADKKAVQERLGTTPNGRRFFALAHGDIDRGDLASASRNLQMALTFEPANPFFREKLDEIRRHAK
jgi:DnaJ-class molecular chaperone